MMSQEFTPGQRLGDYEILAILGAGGMGKVYKVRNVISDRIEAMKVLLPNLTGREQLAERFLREIRLLASLNHPNIAALRTALSLENQLVMIMEYVEGVTIAARLQKGPISASDALNYIDQILSALSYAHRRNIVHRDVKPANVMLTPKGAVKLMDFGIARSESDRGLTMTGTTLGSLNYMPPEQVRGDAADARSDLYSLGVSLYEMVSGRLPFQGDSSYSLMAAHLHDVPKPPSAYRPDLPISLDQVILLALAKDPGQRFQSADAFSNALKSVVLPVKKIMPAHVAHQPQAGIAEAALFQENAAPGANNQLFASSPQLIQNSVAPSTSVVPSGHRGLYIALGALIALVVLFAAGLYLPRRTQTLANGVKGPTSPTAPAQSARNSSSSPAGADASNSSVNSSAGRSLVFNALSSDTRGTRTNTPAGDLSSSESLGSRAPKGGKGYRAASGRSSSGTQQQSTQSDFPQQNEVQEPTVENGHPQYVDAAQLAELEKQADQLTSRASAVSQSLDTFRSQQATQGLGLRGDMAASQERMNSYLSKGQVALQRQDAINAKKYFDLTEIEIGKLEKFLGL